MTLTRYANVPTAELIREAKNSPDELLQELAKRCLLFSMLEWQKAYDKGYQEGLDDRELSNGTL